MKRTNKKDLADRIYATNNGGIPILTCLKVVSQTFDTMREALSKGEGVEVRGFGSFNVRKTKKRIGRNPNSPSVSIEIPEHNSIRFKTARELKKRLQ